MLKCIRDVGYQRKGKTWGVISQNRLSKIPYVERMHEDRLVKKIYRSMVEGTRVKGKQLASWEGIVRKYIVEGRDTDR